MRFLPAGRSAVLVEVDDLAAVLGLSDEIDRRRAAGWAPTLVDVVPGARTVLLDGVEDPAEVARDLQSWTIPPRSAEVGEVLEIGCRYDGADLAEVARQWDVSVPEAVEIHTATPYSVAFCGFGPGFAYLAGLDERHAVARRDSPRPVVSAGSVAVGGLYTGIYPRPSPGGWQLLGRTDAVLWDASRQPAALLQPGQRVRFVDLGR